MKATNKLYGAVLGNAKAHGITFEEIGWKLGMTAGNVRRILREQTIRYEDLKIIANFVQLTEEQKKDILT